MPGEYKLKGEVRKIPASLIVSSRDGLEVRIELRQEETQF